MGKSNRKIMKLSVKALLLGGASLSYVQAI